MTHEERNMMYTRIREEEAEAQRNQVPALKLPANYNAADEMANMVDYILRNSIEPGGRR